jgi:serine phosphatase RsbU (regulator of sigma subunit)
MDRIHEELHLAAAIQREFTSAPLPKVAGLEFGVLFRPVNFVSGDIYNVRPLGEGCAAFFLADAVGHGVPAALLTMVLTSSLTTTEHDGGRVRILEPREVLQRLNTRLCQSCLGSGRFATALYGVIDGATRRVRVAGAGHPWPMLISQSSSTQLRAEGPLLGVFSDAEFTQAEVTLEAGQTLLLYTDGFEAIFPPHAKPTSIAEIESGERRDCLDTLSRLLVTPAGRDLSSTIRQIEHLLDEQSGSLHQADDITALAIAPAAASQAQPVPSALAKAA